MKHYYRIGDEKYINAIEAWSRIRSLQAVNQLTTFELVLEAGKLQHYDWQQSTTKTIESLEEEYATRIRGEYQYVRLLYSGGSDSYSVADAFLRSGNPIDEFILYEWQTMENVCIDAANNTAMKIRWLKDMHAKYGLDCGKISVITIDQKVHERHFQKDWFLKSAGHAGTESFNVNHMADMIDLCPLPPGVTNYVDLMGFEKPRLFADDNMIWFQMNDKNTMYGARKQEEPHIWFYLSGDAPELIRAQCQGAIRVAKMLFPRMPLKDALHKLQNDKNYYHEWCYSVGRRTSKFQNSFVLLAKNVGQSASMNNGRYLHIDQYAGERASAWKAYEEYVDVVKDLGQGSIVPGIKTQKFVLEKNYVHSHW